MMPSRICRTDWLRNCTLSVRVASPSTNSIAIGSWYSYARSTTQETSVLPELSNRVTFRPNFVSNAVKLVGFAETAVVHPANRVRTAKMSLKGATALDQ